MSDRSWRGDAAPWIITAIGLMLIAVMAFNFAFLQGSEIARERYNSERASENASKKGYEKCINEASVEKAIECYKASKQNYAEDARAYSGLSAQWQAAEWTKAATITGSIIGALSLIAASIGVLYVRKTLLETRRIGQAQTRAWIKLMCVAGDEFATRRVQEDDIVAPIKITVENIGNRPARYCYKIFKYRDDYILNDNHIVEKEKYNEFPWFISEIMMPGEQSTIIANVEIKADESIEIQDFEANNGIMWVKSNIVVAVLYEAAGESVIGQTAKSLNVCIDVRKNFNPGEHRDWGDSPRYSWDCSYRPGGDHAE
ncbi:hypothetical protein E3C22_22435 [Jiella endophytica]|uniref:Uncharacterized protein n=1 Tax=Jiella endophytica TaxID=2558362 RepID=A0A4Y8R8V8_9HYPH|nr:hypothetical protein [Jiella endophytica]TFF18062.1 hypothetical protein E3C22_22435 [Jiella endophytica]